MRLRLYRLFLIPIVEFEKFVFFFPFPQHYWFFRLHLLNVCACAGDPWQVLCPMQSTAFFIDFLLRLLPCSLSASLCHHIFSKHHSPGRKGRAKKIFFYVHRNPLRIQRKHEAPPHQLREKAKYTSGPGEQDSLRTELGASQQHAERSHQNQ